ncbi:hypothetical protein RHSIM_Rhsim13G0215300 [Rhododendron simsii]|uniref:F-box domain-containing protein n=1 Tax=Rhododendron simsii TaxID=118357 RepID=A0A834G4D6_RHOSS|nr:hypothetical protein RHSIM_Rhsim13G0215300 [Rhododendron simsii]
MSMEHWAKKKKNEEAENQFQRLPDDVVLHIFDKLSDVQSLCRCFVVSKRFSALIPLVQTVSIETNAWYHFFSDPRFRSENSQIKFLESLSVVNPLRYLCNLDLSPSSSQLNFPHLVFQLKQIQSLNLDLVSDFDADNDTVFKWGAKFASNVYSFTFLCAESLSKQTMESEQDDESENEITTNEGILRVFLGFRCMKEAFLWLGILLHVIPNYPMLQSITITDSNNKGVKLCLGGEKLVGMCSMISAKWAEAWTPENIRVGYFSVLQLPKSGYVMKGVTIFNFQLNVDGDFDADMAMLDVFAAERGVFLEAVVQILENYKDAKIENENPIMGYELKARTWNSTVVLLCCVQSRVIRENHSAVLRKSFGCVVDDSERTIKFDFLALDDRPVDNEELGFVKFDEIAVGSADISENVASEFQRLPDDVAVNIFDKVSDIKWLCRCFVVSKRFSSLIPRVQTVSIKTNARDFLSTPQDSHKFAVLSSSPLNVCGPEFFAKLTQMRSLNLDLVSDFDADNDSVFKWGAKFTSNLDSITFLYAASLTKMMESEQQEENDETENEITQEEITLRLSLAIECAKEAVLWLRILSLDIPKHPMLQSITITDSMNKGVRLCLDGERLVECRNAFRNAIKCPQETLPRTQATIRGGSVPVLRLPMSGYVMKRVAIVHFKLGSGDDSESDAQLAMVDAFAEEQGVFSEAVVQIVKNYKDENKVFFRRSFVGRLFFGKPWINLLTMNEPGFGKLDEIAVESPDNDI